MDIVVVWIERFSDFLWGGSWDGVAILPVGPLAVALLGAGLYMTYLLRGRPLRRFLPAIVNTWKGRKKTDASGSVTPWQALSTALSGQVGTGNLAGVATAITLGGPGAIFWMWITAIFGMALAFAETCLAQKFRAEDKNGQFHGGPMYYITNGLGQKWRWLAVMFCIGTLISAIATGGMIQSNSITQSVQHISRNFAGILPCSLTVPSDENWRILSPGRILKPVSGCALASDDLGGELVSVKPADSDNSYEASPSNIQPVLRNGNQTGQILRPGVIGAIIAVFVFIVIIGGITSIGQVAGKLVPTMALLYVLTALFVLCLNITHIPQAFAAIFAGAFGFDQMAGGFSGGVIALAMRAGVARGLFSNEAGQGSAPIAHAVAKTKNPVMQAEIAMIGVFIDTVIICTMTALVILCIPGDYLNAAGEPVRYAWQAANLHSSAITSAAYSHAFAGGEWIVAISLMLFAFTTIIGWSYYAEQAAVYLFGPRSVLPIRFCWVGIIFIGAFQEVEFIWKLADLSNVFMVLPNLIAILALSTVVAALHKAHKAPT